MRTNPPFNINIPFPDSHEVKPAEKAAPMGDREAKHDNSEKGRKKESEEKKKPIAVDPSGKKGKKVDFLA